MARLERSALSEYFAQAKASLKDAQRVLVHRGPSQLQFWLIAMIIGILAGFAALFFRKGITALQGAVYGAEDVDYLHSFAATLPWYVLLLVPVLGGLIVGIILHRFTPDGRVRSVADVIEGAALRDGRVEIREGLASACASRCAKSMVRFSVVSTITGLPPTP